MLDEYFEKSSILSGALQAALTAWPARAVARPIRVAKRMVRLDSERLVQKRMYRSDEGFQRDDVSTPYGLTGGLEERKTSHRHGVIEGIDIARPANKAARHETGAGFLVGLGMQAFASQGCYSGQPYGWARVDRRGACAG